MLLNLINHLPRNSFYVEAVSNDEELAEAALDQAGPKSAPVRLSNWSPEAELLAAMFDRLGNLIGVQAQLAGGKAPHIDPWPRPSTASQRVARRIGINRHRELVERLRPR